jgi:hypothetical protein
MSYPNFLSPVKTSQISHLWFRPRTGAYDDGWCRLVRSIIAANNVSNLHRYAEVHGTRFFGPGAEVHEWNPDEWDLSHLAAENDSIDALRVPAEIYQSDPS